MKTNQKAAEKEILQSKPMHSLKPRQGVFVKVQAPGSYTTIELFAGETSENCHRSKYWLLYAAVRTVSKKHCIGKEATDR